MVQYRTVESSFSAWSFALALMATSALLIAPPAFADETQIKAPAINTDRVLAQKISAYIDCINRHSNWTMGSRIRYLDWIKDPKRGPTGRERVIYGLYPLYDASDCQAGIANAAALPPPSPELEQSAAAWIEAMAALNIIVTEANTYYELENYKDDKMAKGKAMHPQLMEAFARFEVANDALYEQVVVAQDGLASRRLQRLANDPAQKSQYLLAVLSDSAKRVMRSAKSAGSENFDRDEYTSAVAEYESAYFEAEAYSKQQSAQQGEAFDSIMMMRAMNFLKSAKSMMRKEREGFRFSSGERMLIEGGSGEMIEGHPKHLLEQYNSFVETANRAS